MLIKIITFHCSFEEFKKSEIDFLSVLSNEYQFLFGKIMRILKNS